MSGYHGRTGPNFSQYINNLNTIPQPYDQDFVPTDDLNLDQELALFTNTDFTDFDNLAPLPDSALNFDLGDSNKSSGNDIKYEDLLASATSSANPQPANVPYYPTYPPAIQPAPPASTYPQAANYSSPAGSSPVSSESATQSTGLKRKADSVTATSPQQQLPPDQQSRLAAEEDKRRRNTAASARFRVKKKQREQALERTVKEVNDKNTALEAKVNQLEMENKWLKNLIIEKNGKQTKEEIAEAFQKFRRESEEREPSKGSNEHKDGVGTRS
jgi:Basic region leucine zipper